MCTSEFLGKVTQLTLYSDILHHTLNEVSIQVGRGNCHLTCILPSMVWSQTSEAVGAGGPNLWPWITTLIVPAVGGGGGAERVCSTDRAAEGVALTHHCSTSRSDHHRDRGSWGEKDKFNRLIISQIFDCKKTQSKAEMKLHIHTTPLSSKVHWFLNLQVECWRFWKTTKSFSYSWWLA